MWIVILVVVLIVINSIAQSRRRKQFGERYDVKVCRHCGATQPPHAGYCRECGQQVEG